MAACWNCASASTRSSQCSTAAWPAAVGAQRGGQVMGTGCFHLLSPPPPTRAAAWQAGRCSWSASLQARRLLHPSTHTTGLAAQPSSQPCRPALQPPCPNPQSSRNRNPPNPIPRPRPDPTTGTTDTISTQHTLQPVGGRGQQEVHAREGGAAAAAGRVQQHCPHIPELRILRVDTQKVGVAGRNDGAASGGGVGAQSLQPLAILLRGGKARKVLEWS